MKKCFTTVPLIEYNIEPDNTFMVIFEASKVSVVKEVMAI
jgi:hypothetical protein